MVKLYNVQMESTRALCNINFFLNHLNSFRACLAAKANN